MVFGVCFHDMGVCMDEASGWNKYVRCGYSAVHILVFMDGWMDGWMDE